MFETLGQLPTFVLWGNMYIKSAEITYCICFIFAETLVEKSADFIIHWEVPIN